MRLLYLALLTSLPVWGQSCTTISDTLLSPQSYAGTASTSGATVTRVTGQTFNSLLPAQTMVLGSTSYRIQSITNGNTLVLTASAGNQSSVGWTYNVPLAPGSTITFVLGYSALPIVQGVASATISAGSPNISTCLPPGTYTAGYNVLLQPTGTQTFTRYWNVPSGGPYTVASYPGAPGVETTTPPNPNFTVSLNQLAPLGNPYSFLQVNSAGTGVLWGPLTQPLATPSSSSAACPAGTLSWDAGYLYLCTASGVIKRAALSTF